MEEVFGIDLGTTYSAIARVNEFGQAEIIKDREGKDTTPSVVYFENADNVVVGLHAKATAVSEAEHTVSLIKRDMGTATELTFFGKPYRPETISAIILKELVDNAQATTGSTSNRVVITVPAYFGLLEKEATRQAGEIAGLEVVGIVTEPVAAALSVGIRGEEPKNLFVYDLGGGTFDTTVMRVAEGTVDVLVIDGNRRLGGADWDALLLTYVAEKFQRESGIEEDPLDDEEFFQRLQSAVEEAKIALSFVESKRISCSYGETRLQVEVTREEFENVTRDLLDQTFERVDATLEWVKQNKPDFVIDEVLLVGGSSRMPMVANGMRERYGWEPRLTELDLAVAKGAALYGQRAIAVSGDADGGGASDAAAEGDGGGRSRGRRLVSGPALQVNNVLSRGVGVKFVTEDSPQDAPDFYIEFLAHAQDTLPAAPHCTAATASDGQTQVVINVYEQNSDIESEAVASNRELTVDGGLYITGLPSLPKGSPVEITIDISSDGIATIEAFEPSTGQKVMANLSLAVMQAADQKLATEIVAGLKRAEY